MVFKPFLGTVSFSARLFFGGEQGRNISPATQPFTARMEVHGKEFDLLIVGPSLRSFFFADRSILINTYLLETKHIYIYINLLNQNNWSYFQQVPLGLKGIGGKVWRKERS